MKKKNITIIDKFIRWSLTKLNQWNLKRIEKYGTHIIDNPNNYEVLLPNTDSDKKGYYEDALRVSLETPKVNNIAITGPYGSGKSSFIESFKEKNAEYNYLPISLATFKNQKEEELEEKQDEATPSESSTSDEGSNDKSKFELHQDIERSILQQFFYREKESTVSQSRFKKIKRISKFDVLSNTIMISFLGFWSFFLFNHFKKEKMVVFIEFFTTYFHVFTIVYGLVGLAFLYRVFYYFSTLKIDKFNLKKGEITLAKQDKASILNEHLDEILYFFEVTNYNVVFFEDIDRFDDTEIFIKLRELNQLINNSKQINRRIIFIYAIRDDMFIDKERTKFFDFIVPIIPYINPSNSEMKLLEKFEQQIKDKNIDENFISQVSLYIDDMRLLLNIYNEYIVYKNNLNSEKLNHNQILALVICKNFYPLDFAKLHTREGIIYDFFENKPQYIRRQIEKYNQNKKNILEIIKNIKNENIKSLDELKMIYIGKLFAETNADAMTISKYKEQTLNNLLASDILENINEDTSCQGLIKEKSYYNNYPLELKNHKKTTFKDIEYLINPNFTYLERKKIIDNKNTNKINDLKKEIESTDKKINQLKQASLKQLFETSSAIITKGYENKDLLIFLVRNGYIDEYYEHNISYFHSGGITQDDREFLLSIQNYNALDFTFRLGNIKKLIEKLKVKNFKQIEILNFHLTDYLLLTYHSYLNQANIYFKKVSDDSALSVEFIFSYLEYTSNSYKKEFIKKLEWKNLWLHIYNNFSEDKQNDYFNLIFRTLGSNKIIELNIDDSVKKYLEKQTHLPKYSNIQNEKCKELISELELDFSSIENPSDNKELFNYIYENWNYELSELMIKIMLSAKGNIDVNNLEEAHLTTIKSSEADELIAYIDTNLNEYVENILVVGESNIKESQETVIYLLSSEEVTIENKIKIIQKEEVKVSDITSVVDKELWIELFKNNKVVATWDNVMAYYLKVETLDDALIGYLNIDVNADEVSKIRIDKTYCEENKNFNTKILRNIIESNKFDINSYEKLVKNLGYWYKNLDISNLDEEKIVLLVQYNNCQFEKECFDLLERYTTNQHITLIEKNRDEFLEKFDEFEIDEDDLLLLLQSNKFNIEEKFTFIEKTDLSDITNKKLVKESISKFYIDNSQSIGDIELFDNLFYGENKYDLELLILQIPYLEDCASCKKYLDEFGSGLNELLELSAKPLSIKKNQLNKKLLEKLQEKDCISSFSEKKSMLGKIEFKVNRKRG